MKRSALVEWLLPLADRAARRYIAGPGPAHALEACVTLGKRGIASTVGYWNQTAEPPRRIIESCMTTADLMASARVDCYLSVKAPALGFNERLLQALTTRCREQDVGLHFDALGPDAVDRTLALLARLRPEAKHLGCTLPGRWQRSLSDADVAIELGLRVRVVKGEWVADEGNALDAREGFLAVVDRLAGRASHVAVATHDWRLARHALARLRAASTSASVELLLGLPMRPMFVLAESLGVPLRVYVPYGHARLPYRVRAAAGRPEIAWWFLRDLWGGPRIDLPVPARQVA
jgi:proline dehydrogenase